MLMDKRLGKLLFNLISYLQPLIFIFNNLDFSDIPTFGLPKKFVYLHSQNKMTS
jgi:hypothetical protein